MQLGYSPLPRVSQGVEADAGQSRGAQSGEADRNAVWLVRQRLEPRLGRFDPELVLKEIQQLVPGYRSAHVDMVSGYSAEAMSAETNLDLIRPSRDDLFSSGTLGQYSQILEDVLEKSLKLPYESSDGADAERGPSDAP